MKFDFKKAAKHVKSSTIIFTMAAAGFAYGGTKAYDYYKPSPEKTAHEQCLDGKTACTPEQLALVKKHFDLSTTTTIWLVMPQMWLLMGLGYRKDEKNKEKMKEMGLEINAQMDKYYEELGKRLEITGKLEETEAKLAPYLADDKRKADTAAEAAAKQELNQMAQDATTLQGKITVTKKPITIKQTPKA